ncbi:hypothetical protein [Azohydromonas australica]|uniref:hypothetical protein n=1 Tax=Azohydromonas australica TaxID=364039 RepID=UPI00040DC943|nr:hypothetical protein [Azohydromonas australica]
MDNPQQELFGLLALAEEQQKVVTKALQGLAKERAELAKEREALAEERAVLTDAAERMAELADAVTTATEQAAPRLQQAAGTAAGAAVRQSLAGISGTAVAALKTATEPVLTTINGAAQAAREADGTLTRSLNGFGWKLAAVVGGVSSAAVLVVIVAAWSMVEWQLHQMAGLVEQHAALEDEVQQLQANIAALAKKGGRIVMTECGGRLCIEASSNQGKDDNGQPIPLRGAWHTTDGRSVALVIPRGY